jgi:hypothetical protein
MRWSWNRSEELIRDNDEELTRDNDQVYLVVDGSVTMDAFSERRTSTPLSLI